MFCCLWLFHCTLNTKYCQICNPQTLFATTSKHVSTGSFNFQMSFFSFWVSVNTFYGSSGTEAVSNLRKWFYKQFTEAWCLLTWKPFSLSLTYYHWYNLFSGICSIGRWFSQLRLFSHASERSSHPLACVLKMNYNFISIGNLTLANFSRLLVFLFCLFLSENILSCTSRLRLEGQTKASFYCS